MVRHIRNENKNSVIHSKQKFIKILSTHQNIQSSIQSPKIPKLIKIPNSSSEFNSTAFQEQVQHNDVSITNNYDENNHDHDSEHELSAGRRTRSRWDQKRSPERSTTSRSRWDQPRTQSRWDQARAPRKRSRSRWNQKGTPTKRSRSRWDQPKNWNDDEIYANTKPQLQSVAMGSYPNYPIKDQRYSKDLEPNNPTLYRHDYLQRVYNYNNNTDSQDNRIINTNTNTDLNNTSTVTTTSEKWPPIFETNGAYYTYDPVSCMYYESVSNFFYDLSSKLYYDCTSKQYFRYEANKIPPFQILPENSTIKETTITTVKERTTTAGEKTTSLLSDALAQEQNVEGECNGSNYNNNNYSASCSTKVKSTIQAATVCSRNDNQTNDDHTINAPEKPQQDPLHVANKGEKKMIEKPLPKSKIPHDSSKKSKIKKNTKESSLSTTNSPTRRTPMTIHDPRRRHQLERMKKWGLQQAVNRLLRQEEEEEQCDRRRKNSGSRGRKTIRSEPRMHLNDSNLTITTSGIADSSNITSIITNVANTTTTTSSSNRGSAPICRSTTMGRPISVTASTSTNDDDNKKQQPKICFICRRSFRTVSCLKRHEMVSKLHKANLGKKTVTTKEK